MIQEQQERFSTSCSNSSITSSFSVSAASNENVARSLNGLELNLSNECPSARQMVQLAA